MLFDNVKECLQNPDITAIHIATPNVTHFSNPFTTMSGQFLTNGHINMTLISFTSLMHDIILKFFCLIGNRLL
jgi:hypothetical protein